MVAAGGGGTPALIGEEEFSLDLDGHLCLPLSPAQV
jgi:hypothetical protein